MHTMETGRFCSDGSQSVIRISGVVERDWKDAPNGACGCHVGIAFLAFQWYDKEIYGSSWQLQHVKWHKWKSNFDQARPVMTAIVTFQCGLTYLSVNIYHCIAPVCLTLCLWARGRVHACICLCVVVCAHASVYAYGPVFVWVGKICVLVQVKCSKMCCII